MAGNTRSPNERDVRGGSYIGGGNYIDRFQSQVVPNVATENRSTHPGHVDAIAGPLRGRTGINIVEQADLEPGAHAWNPR